MATLHAQYLRTDIDQYVSSTAEKMVDKSDLRQEMVDKWSIKPTLAGKLVDILAYVSDRGEFTTDAIEDQIELTKMSSIVISFN